MQQFYFLARCFTLVILLCHYNFSALARAVKFTGYYIDTKHDTIKGSFPKYRQWHYNPVRVTFIPAQSGTPVQLTPAVCREFHIDGYETYRAFHGKRMTNPAAFSPSTNEDSTDRYVSLTTFLREFAVSDTYTFYSFKDDKRINMYYATTDGVITELIQKVYISGNHSVYSMGYKKQLQSLFPDKTEKIEQLFYSEESLSAFLGRQTNVVLAGKKEEKMNSGLLLSAGFAQNSLSFRPDASLAFSENEYKSRQVPVIAIGYLVPFSRNFNRAFFLPQIKISSLQHTARTVYNSGVYPISSTTFRSSPVISLGFHVGYNIINRPDLRFSVAPGAGVYFLTKFRQTDEYKFSPTNAMKEVTEMDNLKPLVDVQATLIIKKRYVIWSAYNLPMHITIYPSAKDRFTSKQVGVGYKFK